MALVAAPVVDTLCALAALLVALLVVRVAGHWTPTLPGGRHDTIDGLRGYLAFGVFLHHAAIWYGYLHGGRWALPSSHLFVNLGQGSVSLFFMITSFLFYGKLLARRDGQLDWLRLYCGRLLRLYPLYLFALALLLLIVGQRTQWQLREPLADLLRHIGHWLAFTAVGTPDINGLRNTTLVMAGVTWSLPYEWAFYGCLPLLALARRIRVPPGWLALGAATLVAILVFALLGGAVQQYAIAFGGGIVAAHAVRSAAWRAFAVRRAGSLALLLALATAFCAFPSAYKLASALLLIAAFALVAAGADLFGLLRARLSRVFGEYAYSLYLLHGFALYVTFDLLIGPQRAMTFSAGQHWMVVALLTVPLVAGCALCFRWIEAPAMARTDTLVRLLRRPGVAESGEAQPLRNAG